MKRLCLLTIVLCGFFAGAALPAKYAGEPFSMGVGARPLGMGGAVVAGPFDATSGYWNPAGLPFVYNHQIQTMHAETFGSLLNHDFIGFSSHNGRQTGLTSYGFYIYYLGGGGIKLTAFDQDTQRPYVVDEASHNDLMIGASLGGLYHRRFSYGTTFKVIYRDIAVESAWGLGLDVGAVYRITDRFSAALVVTDVTSTFLAYSNDNTESILPAVKPALSYRYDFRDLSVRVSGQSVLRFEGRRDVSELLLGDISADFQSGLEIGYRNMAFGRVGYDHTRFTAGLGAAFRSYMIDLAYLHHGDLDETFRISAGIEF